MTVALAAICLALIAVLVLRERAHDSERQLLLDRIQAPQTVIAQRVQNTSEDDLLPAVELDDDAGYWAAKGIVEVGE